LVAVAVLGGSAAAGGRPTLRVGLVLQTVSIGPGGDPYEYDALVGLRKAVQRYRVAGKSVAPSPTGTLVPAISYLAHKHYDLIIAVGVFEARDLAVAARHFPHQRFAILDVGQRTLRGKPSNIEGVPFKAEQAGYLAGYLAARMDDMRPGKHVVSSVGGFSVPQVNGYIAGFQAGAKRADPRIETLNGYANDFLDPDKCRRVALAQIAMGSGVVFSVAGGCGLGALAAAKASHVWGVGVDVDQSSLGAFVLTSAVKRLDLAVLTLVSSLRQGRLKTGGDLVFDLRNGGVGLGAISPKVPRSVLLALARVRAEIVAGKIRVPTAIR